MYSLAREGLTVPQIARALARDTSVIHKRLKEAGITPAARRSTDTRRENGNGLTSQEREAILKMIDTGMSAERVAVLINRSRQVVQMFVSQSIGQRQRREAVELTIAKFPASLHKMLSQAAARRGMQPDQLVIEILKATVMGSIDRTISGRASAKLPEEQGCAIT